MAKTSALCCPPTPANPLYPHKKPDGTKDIPTTPGYSCTNPLFVADCGSTTPPVPLTLTGQDCAGAPVSVTGTAGQLMGVVQAQGTVFKVQLCNDPKDYEKLVLCEKTTGHKIIVISDLTVPTAPVVTYWDLNLGAAWVGTPDQLEDCANNGATMESDGRDVCVDGVSLVQWVLKDNGQPTGTAYYTTPEGALVTVPTGAVITSGVCAQGCPSVTYLGVQAAW